MKRLYYWKPGEQSNLVALTDASIRNNRNNFHSTSWYFIFLSSSLITAKSATQRRGATSAPEAELFEIMSTTKQLLFLKGLLKDFGRNNIKIALLTDSSSSVATIKDPISSRYKYLSLYLAFIKAEVEKKAFEVKHLRRIQNFADMLTKALDGPSFMRFSNMINTPFQWRHLSGNGVRDWSQWCVNIVSPMWQCVRLFGV